MRARVRKGPTMGMRHALPLTWRSAWSSACACTCAAISAAIPSAAAMRRWAVAPEVAAPDTSARCASSSAWIVGNCGKYRSYRYELLVPPA